MSQNPPGRPPGARHLCPTRPHGNPAPRHPPGPAGALARRARLAAPPVPTQTRRATEDPALTPDTFIARWRGVTLKERSAAQSHFNDLCALLALDAPVAADPTGDWFTFEKGASKTTGGKGWADVWRKGCFGWEYKGKHADLDAANRQLLTYSVALENPPLLIVSDMDRIIIRTNWTNTVQRTHTIHLDDLRDAAHRDTLRAAFTDPERLKPTKTRDALTEDAAAKFSALAQNLRDRGHAPGTVAHFVNRLVFCMFAEDVNLLPGKLFQKMLEASRAAPADFAPNAASLFAAMRSGGRVGFESVAWFNGGLFDDDTALPLEKPDIENLLTAAKLDWSQIDPAILGTLFERGLDPAKRSQLGAHYTDRDKIMKIVTPVIIDPLAGGMGRDQIRHRGRTVPRGRREIPGRRHPRPQPRPRPARRLSRTAQKLPRARPRLRLRQLPLHRAPRAQGHRAPRQSRRRGPRPRRAASRRSAPRPCAASSSTPTPPSSPASRSGSARSSGCASTASTPAATRSCVPSTPSNAATPS